MRRALVIDDDGAMCRLVAAMLEQEGYEVVTAADGQAGLAAFRRHHPDLVVTDIVMPRKGGLAAIREIRDLDPAARVVAISGGGRTGRLNFLSTARTFPGVRTLQKPFRQAELVATVREVMRAA